MGTLISNQLCISPLFHRKSKPRIIHGRRNTEEISTRINIDHSSKHEDNIVSNNINFIGDFVPERYLVLLTEQMTEMLFRIITCNEIAQTTTDNSFDHRTTFATHTGIDNVSSTPNSKSTNDRPSLNSQLMHPSCMKCKMKLMTIEEFHEIHLH